MIVQSTPFQEPIDETTINICILETTESKSILPKYYDAQFDLAKRNI